MQIRLRAVLFTALASFAAAQPSAAAERYPPAIAQMAEDDVKSCPAGRKAGRLQDGYLTPADLNGDGVDDYVVDNNLSNCFDVSLGCGSAGCPANAMMSSGGSFREVEIGYIHDWTVIQQNGRAALRLSVHGSACNLPGAAPCSVVMTWNGAKFVEGRARPGALDKAAAASPAAVAPAAAPKPKGAQPDTVRPYGEWVGLEGGKCPDGGQGIVIEPSRIIVDYGGDLTTFKPVKLDGCKDGVCAFSGPGRKWSVTRLGPDRIVFEGPHNQKVSDRSEAQRNKSQPGCSMVNVYP